MGIRSPARFPGTWLAVVRALPLHRGAARAIPAAVQLFSVQGPLLANENAKDFIEEGVL